MDETRAGIYRASILPESSESTHGLLYVWRVTDAAQKIRSTAYTNVNVFGLAFTLVVGGFLIVLSYTLEYMVYWLQKHRPVEKYRRLELLTNSTLQLQRLANESLGVGHWTNATHGIPITKKGEHLAMLDVSDVKHPKLQAPDSRWMHVLGKPTESDTATESSHSLAANKSPNVEVTEHESDVTAAREFLLQPPVIGPGGTTIRL